MSRRHGSVCAVIFLAWKTAIQSLRLKPWEMEPGVSVTMSQLFADDGQAAKPVPAFKNGHAPKLNRTAANQLRRIEQRSPG